MIYNTSRKIRIYPNENQIELIENTFSCVRLVWNKLLEKSIENYYDPNTEFYISNYADIVREYDFLNRSNKEFRVDRHALSNERMFLIKAFRKYFNYVKDIDNVEYRKDGKPKYFPRFKSRKYSRNSYTNYNAWSYSNIDNKNHMIKIPCLGWVKFNPREKKLPIAYKIKNVTISKSTTGKYYCSICFEYEDSNVNGENFVNRPDDNIKIIGLDYSSSSLYIDSNNNKPNYPKYLQQNLKRLRILNKQLSRRQKGGKNYYKTLTKLRILNEKISNQRKDFLHKLSTTITKSYDIVCVEDINMRSISKNMNLGRATCDNSFGILRDMLMYKINKQHFKLFIKIDKWYPSSKTCSCCGFINKDLTLKDRIYNCPNCGYVIDRDFNAAINIKQYGIDYVNKTFHDIRQFNFI